jgi:hypothetical protein
MRWIHILKKSVTSGSLKQSHNHGLRKILRAHIWNSISLSPLKLHLTFVNFSDKSIRSFQAKNMNHICIV